MTRTELVGRDRELAALTEWLTAAFDGDPRLVLCAGEPGVGKTRLAEELAGLTRERGVPVVWGRIAEADGATAVLAVAPDPPGHRRGYRCRAGCRPARRGSKPLGNRPRGLSRRRAVLGTPQWGPRRRGNHHWAMCSRHFCTS